MAQEEGDVSRGLVQARFEGLLRENAQRSVKGMEAAERPGCLAMVFGDFHPESRIPRDVEKARINYEAGIDRYLHGNNLPNWNKLSEPGKAWFARWSTSVVIEEIEREKMNVKSEYVRSQLPVLQRRLIILGAKVSEEFGSPVNPLFVDGLAVGLFQEKPGALDSLGAFVRNPPSFIV